MPTASELEPWFGHSTGTPGTAGGVHSVTSQGSNDSSFDSATLGFRVLPVRDDQWGIVAWLWQAFRHDLATVVNGLPYGDGRYQASRLKKYPSSDSVGYLAWRAHPKTGEDAPIAFAMIEGLEGARRTIEGFWVAPAARRSGTGRRFALDVLSRHEGPWTIAFQHDNIGASRFWRDVANHAFGPEGWAEEERHVPGLPDARPDHYIESL